MFPGEMRWEADRLVVIDLPDLIPTRYDSVWVHLPMFSASNWADLRPGSLSFRDSCAPPFKVTVRESLPTFRPVTVSERQKVPPAIDKPRTKQCP